MLKKPFGCLLFLAASYFLNPVSIHAQGEMWNPAELTQNQKQLTQEGLTIPPSKIYNENETGLNNAVVLFGGGCTASFISDQGLLLTNHHCGYSYAQKLSTPENNFFQKGFWARKKTEELPCPGLTITITQKMANVTNYILKGIPDSLPEPERQKIISERMENMAKAYSSLERTQAVVKAFYSGNEYWVIGTQVFKDVRMVAFPPNGIGKFGADTDNWMWPRETGDFSIFRVYANKRNQPADYSPSNVPFKPKAYLPISVNGYDKGTTALVYGFPYVTEEYLSSYELERVQYIMYPIRVAVRQQKLRVWDSAMSADPGIFLKYAAKQSSLSNGYKKWRGAIYGLSENKVMAKKKAEEGLFKERAALADPTDTALQLLFPKMKAIAQSNQTALSGVEYAREAVMGVELVRQASVLEKLLHYYRNPSDKSADLNQLKKNMNGFYKNYVPEVDKRVFEALMPMYMKQNNLIVAPGLQTQLYMSGNRYDYWANNVIDNSLLIDSAKMEGILSGQHPEDTFALKKDPAFQLYHAVKQFETNTLQPQMEDYRNRMAPLNRLYLAKRMQYYGTTKTFYPDANQTLRLALGKVAPITGLAGDSWQTKLSDLIKRHNPDVEELRIPEKLQELYAKHDFGKWAVKGDIPINFMTTAHTSGGNSGSPVLNAKGQLIGLNFDRPWQSTMSDFYYSTEDCRNISVDIRYILFLLDKYAHADNLIREMKFVK